MSTQLLMIEDDARLAQMVGEYLGQSGMQLTHRADGASGLARLQGPEAATLPDLVILDLMLPVDFERAEAQRLGDWRAAVAMAAQHGADAREQLARIRAVLRRHGDGGPPVTQTLRFGALEIDRDARSVTVAGQPAELTSYQFDLLVALAERAGRVLTRDQIMEAVRGRELEAFDRSIDVHMGRIRAAIEQDAKNPRRILTVRGVGYVFAKQQD